LRINEHTGQLMLMLGPSALWPAPAIRFSFTLPTFLGITNYVPL